ncbi:MAG: methyltransferase domain-containing protein [Planctomycetaceae bacterium]|nr:methyltransferase domain-containing protein [Planctomycetaceae bacterium]MCP4812752.1 methyltransferase domain-containing protein [Planctomycetaceae bacterium]
MVKVFVPGVFDVFHIGHLNYLMAAAAAGDSLIVGVQDDRDVETHKGVELVNSLAERIAIIEQLRFVDEAISYRDIFQGPLLEALGINVFACGEEYGETDLYPDQQKTLQYCHEHGIQVVHIPRTPRVSSTRIRSQLKTFWTARATQERELPAGVTVLGSFNGDQEKVASQTQREVDLVTAAVDNPGDKSLLDTACGDGRLLVSLAKQFNKVVGFDYVGELLELAQRRLSDAHVEAELFEGDATTFQYDGEFDVVLLSGILPCLDNEQCQQMLERLEDWSAEQCTLLVRSSVGLEKRIEVINQYSKALNTRYTGYYRTVEETRELFQGKGWQLLDDERLYQNHADTAVWWFSFSRG